MENNSLNFDFNDGTLRISLIGEIDHHRAVSVRTSIDAKTYELRPKKLLMDLSGVDFMDASGLGLIMGRYILVQKIGGEFWVASPNENVLRLIKFSGLDRLIKIEKTDQIRKIKNDNAQQRLYSGKISRSSTSSENMINEIKFSLPSISMNEGVARDVCAAFCAQLDPAAEEMADVKCAVSEAVTNCVNHAYPCIVGTIYITVRICGDRIVRIDIRDKGCGIENVSIARQPLFTTDAESEHGGMGFTVMENCCDRLTVKSKLGKGTIVTLVKQFS